MEDITVNGKEVAVQSGDTGAILEIKSDQLRFHVGGGDKDLTAIHFMNSKKEDIIRWEVDRKKRKLSVIFPLKDPGKPDVIEKELDDVFKKNDTVLVVYVHEQFHQIMVEYVDQADKPRPKEDSVISFIKYTYDGKGDPFFATDLQGHAYENLKQRLAIRSR